MSQRKFVQRPPDSRYVTIFGAGIAGLTAAHELVERGFRVQVWEPTSDPRDPRRGLDVGGLARTQWGRVGWSDEQAEKEKSPGEEVRPIVHFLQKLYVLEPEWTPGVPAHGPTKRLDPKSTFEILIVGLTLLAPSEQRQRVRLMLDATGDLYGPRARHLRYDAASQTYRAKLGSNDVVVPLREPARLPPGATAILHIWCKNRLRDTRLFVASWKPTIDHLYGLGEHGQTAPAKVIRQLLARLRKCAPYVDHVYVEVTTRGDQGFDDYERLRRAQVVWDLLNVGGSEPDWIDGSIKFFLKIGARDVTFELVHLRATKDALPPRPVAGISFRARERWLPGEHGHRFFPAFYHHVFDTMKRTPILETVDKPELFMAQEEAVGIARPEPLRYVETGRSAFDNLKVTATHALAFTGHRPSVLTRSKPKSFEEVRDYLRVFFGSKDEGGFGANPRDTTFFTLKVLQYMTSCEERREQEYQEKSWWEFIEGNSFEKPFQELIVKWPEALVAMDAHSCDARTNGSTSVQILLDLFRDGGYRDGILKGPTNEAWLEHWRRYLEAQGVEFIQGELEDFELVPVGDGSNRLWPRVRCYEPRYPMNEHHEPELLPGYFLLALSANEVARVARNLKRALADTDSALPADCDLARAAEIDTSGICDDSGNPEFVQAKGNNEFQHYAGMQFYFAEDVFWLNGQVYHPDSAFGLTTVSQARFWEDKMDWEHGYRGVLSVIIANWGTKGSEGLPAHQLSPAKLAAEVWRQIKDSVKGRSQQTPHSGRSRTPISEEPPEPIFWHLDDNLSWHAKAERYRNKAPFHIIPPKKWAKLPGDLTPERGYDVTHGIALAGMYTKTFTRIPSMEAANESARHAVNAILRDAKLERNRAYCDIWNPEDRELDDLAWLKDLDRKLFERGRGHVFELYGLKRLVRFGLRGGPEDPFDPIRFFWAINKTIRAFSGLLSRG
jgi:uncharacterized protein with NAD-binding domain and iron-sulfur cluster